MEQKERSSFAFEESLRKINQIGSLIEGLDVSEKEQLKAELQRLMSEIEK